MRSLLFFALIALIVAFGLKYYYKPVPAAEPPVKAVEPPPAVVKPPPPLLDSEGTKKVMEAIKDTNPNVRWQALEFLVQINAPQADDFIYEMLQHDTDAGLRRNIVLMLGGQRRPKSPEYLAKALQDIEPSVRVAALEMLDKISDYSAAPAISELLHDPDDSVRLKAIYTINSLQAKRAEEIRRQQEEALRRQKEKEQQLRGQGGRE